jgi:hypothetical protein
MYAALHGDRTSDCSADCAEEQHAEGSEGPLGSRCGASIRCVFGILNGMITRLLQLGLSVIELFSGLGLG